MLALGACGGSASQAPSSGPNGSQSPVETILPTGGPGSSAVGGDGSAAFSAATTALDALDSYAFRVEIQSTTLAANGTATTTHQLMSGVVVNKPAKASSLEQGELDASGTLTNGTGIMVIGTEAWIRSGDATSPWTAIPAAQADVFIQSMAAFRPEQMFSLYFAGIGGNFTEAGQESKNGVQTTHYKGDEAVGSILGAIAGFQGTWSSDVWIAKDGGFLVHSEAGAEAAAGAAAGSYKITVDITDPNAAGPIEPPK